MSNKDAVIYFRAEPRLAKAIREGATLSELTVSDYIRVILRKSLGLEVTPPPDYAANCDKQSEVEHSSEFFPCAK